MPALWHDLPGSGTMAGVNSGPSNLFVYGSLRRGGGVFDRFLAASVSKVYPATLDGYALYGKGLPFPAIAPRPGGVVHGEVVSLDPDRADEVIGSLDFYEGMEYRRVVVHPVTDSGETMDAWAFVASERAVLSAEDEITGGDWLGAR